MEAGCGVHTCNVACRRLSQKDLEFEARTGYIRSSRPNPEVREQPIAKMEAAAEWKYMRSGLIKQNRTHSHKLCMALPLSSVYL